jgi:methylenetetrahydrofolate reductase (NADPH)
MATTNPLWVDVTWGAGGGTFDITLDLCAHIVQNMGLDVLMHLTCTGMTRERVIEALDRAKELGIKNILALRGDPPFGEKNWTPIENGFAYATQLVEFIREKYGNFFCIVVAGYPEVHAQATSYEDDIKHLKEKVDAGADAIITQLFYSNECFFKWVKDCKAAGIDSHFIPGLMPILGYDRFQRTVDFCKLSIPQSLTDKIDVLKADDEKVREFGVQFGIE